MDEMGAIPSWAGESVGEISTPQGSDPPKVTMRGVLLMLEQQDFKCALTGRLLTPATAALDHVVSIHDGGTHSLLNAQILHKEVNRAKHTLSSEAFVSLCREVVRWADGKEAEKTQATFNAAHEAQTRTGAQASATSRAACAERAEAY